MPFRHRVLRNTKTPNTACSNCLGSLRIFSIFPVADTTPDVIALYVISNCPTQRGAYRCSFFDSKNETVDEAQFHPLCPCLRRDISPKYDNQNCLCGFGLRHVGFGRELYHGDIYKNGTVYKPQSCFDSISPCCDD